MIPPESRGRLANKIIVITGAAGGQGAAEALAAVGEGATVVATDLAAAPGEEMAAALRHRPTLSYRQLDVSDPAAWTELAAELTARFGRVEGLVNNAGITWRARLEEVLPEDFMRVYQVNVVGPLLGMQHLAPLMPAGASIVNVGSVAALTAHFPVAYTASKWALRGLSQVACVELGRRGIRVNLVHPGHIETPMTASASAAFRDATVAETPLSRTGSSAEVAGLVIFLLSDEAAFVSGAEIPVDGGLTAHGGMKSVSDAVRYARSVGPG